MLFKVGNEIIDTETTPVALIFKTKDEAELVGEVISNIKNGVTELPTDGNGNWWFMHPGDWDFKTRDEWSVLTDEQKILLEHKSTVTKPSLEL